MALLAKNSGMVRIWPIPMKRSRVFTRQAMTREKVEKNAAPSMTDEEHPQEGERAPVHPDAKQHGKEVDDDRLGEAAQARGDCLAEDERGPRRGAHEKLVEDSRGPSPR